MMTTALFLFVPLNPRYSTSPEAPTNSNLSLTLLLRRRPPSSITSVIGGKPIPAYHVLKLWLIQVGRCGFE